VIHRQAGTRPSASWVFVPRHPPASAGGFGSGWCARGPWPRRASAGMARRAFRRDR
jgi:hypothetical protein